MAHFLHSTSVSHNARQKFPSLGLITLRELSAAAFHGHVRDIFPYPPLRLQRLGCVSMTFTKGRSERFTMKGGGGGDLLLGVFFCAELAARPVLQEVVFPCRLCNTISAELRKSGRVGDVFGFLTMTTQPVKNFTRKKAQNISS